jgi:hypothetical protein
MQNLAYQLDLTSPEEIFAPPAREPSVDGTGADQHACTACGEKLFGAGAEASSWQSWQIFWDALGMSNVEIVCGACGEYLSKLFAAKE